MAKLRGEVTLAAVELKCQGWYMAFQVIQVFLVTTFSSGAASVVQDIIKDHSSAMTLLAESLPKASNFYITYYILQGLGIAAGDLLSIGALAMLHRRGQILGQITKKDVQALHHPWGSRRGFAVPKIWQFGNHWYLIPLLLLSSPAPLTRP